MIQFRCRRCFMAQGIIGGATSYEEQSLIDILEDINGWLSYTENKKEFIHSKKQELIERNYWDNIPFNFQLTINTTLSYLDTIIYDLNLVKIAIEKHCITKKEILLLNNIGLKAMAYNSEYPKTFKEDRVYWHEYGKPDFMIAEELYGRGRDYFVTMQDAANAACRLEDYMEKGQVTNNTLNVSGSVSGSQIQQGTSNSVQTMLIEMEFDYEMVLDILQKVQKISRSDDFIEDFGEYADKLKNAVTEAIELVNKKEEPSKIKSFLLTIKDLAMRVSSSVIATGIVGMISQLPIS